MSSSTNPTQNNTTHQNPHPKTKSTSGRKKLPMEKIENGMCRQVTFSKRKGGLVKKANELCTLTGTQMALFIFSPTGKVFSYGNPSVERVTSRWNYAHAYTHDEQGQAPGSVMKAANLSTQNEEIIKSEAKLEMLMNRRSELMDLKTDAQMRGIYPPDLETLNYEQLCSLKASILGFKRNFRAKMKEAKKIAEAAKSKAPQSLHQRAQSSSNVVGSSSSSCVVQHHEAQACTQMVPGVFSNNTSGNLNTNKGMYGGYASYNASSSLQRQQVQPHNHMVPVVFNNNSTNENIDPSQGMYTGVFHQGGFFNYNPRSLCYGGSSSFSFPYCNAGQPATTSSALNVEVSKGGFEFPDPQELQFNGVRLQSHVPEVVNAPPACDGNRVLSSSNNAHTWLDKHVAEEEEKAEPGGDGETRVNSVGDDFIEYLMRYYTG